MLAAAGSRQLADVRNLTTVITIRERSGELRHLLPEVRPQGALWIADL